MQLYKQGILELCVPFFLGLNPDMCGINFMHDIFKVRIDKGNNFF